MRDDLGEGGFARARGAVEDDGGERVGVDHAAQELAFGEEVALPDDVGEGAWSDACGERFHGGEFLLALCGPEIVHTGIVRGLGGSGLWYVAGVDCLSVSWV